MNFNLIKKLKDAHSRIIYGITWSHNDNYFATCSREKQKSVKVWQGIQGNDNNESAYGTLVFELPEDNPSATAIRFFPSLIKKDRYALIVGLESGIINIWDLNTEKVWTKIFIVPDYLSPCDAIRRIKFNSRLSDKEND
jgi:elongator complex protein 2